MGTEETELALLVLQLGLQLAEQGIRDVGGHQRRAVLHLQARRHEGAKRRPVLIRQLVAEGGPEGVRLFIVLQNQRVRHLVRRLDRPGKIGLLAGFHDVPEAVRQQVTVFSAFICFTLLHIDGVHDQTDDVPRLIGETVKARFAAHGGHLRSGVGSIVLAVEVQDGLHEVLGTLIISGVLHLDVRQRKHTRCEIAGSSTAALLVAGVEAHFSLRRDTVLGDQFLAGQPLAEILAHAGLLEAAEQRQLAGECRPLDPGMGCQLIGHRAIAGQGRTQIMAAQDNHLLEGIIVGDIHFALRGILYLVQIIVFVVETQTGVHARIGAQRLEQHCLPRAVFFIQRILCRSKFISVGLQIPFFHDIQFFRIVRVGLQPQLVTPLADCAGDGLDLLPLRHHGDNHVVEFFHAVMIRLPLCTGGGHLPGIRPVESIRIFLQRGILRRAGRKTVDRLRVFHDIPHSHRVFTGIMLVGISARLCVLRPG